MVIIEINQIMLQQISFIDMKDQREQQEYDVYFRGTKEELFAFLYPLTGPHNSLFDHFEMKKMLYDVNKKSFEMHYEPKDFQNIDKQKEQIVYNSTLLSTQSNYFYSLFQPQYNCFIWQNVNNFVEMRPKNRGMINTKQKQIIAQQSKIQLQTVQYNEPNNKIRELVDDTIVTPMKQNWEVSKDQYLIHLAK